MCDFEINSQQEEKKYLNETFEAIKKQIRKETDSLQNRNKSMISARRDMWESGAHFADDVDRIPELLSYLSEVDMETRSYGKVIKSLEKYDRMLNAPYFGRIDFKEKGSSSEKIYIGMYSLIDSDTKDIYVYDWRAPISSMFYRCEIGKGSYMSPMGIIEGDILLKRQYKIEKSKLKYFFDSSIKIDDEILQQVLSRNSSPKMRNVVETIQKEQDIIIRDTENELLIVQGAAGSGKTSIALHRVAFLLYEGLSSRLQANNVIIVSPNDTFSSYIAGVLPELGEDNVENITFNKIIESQISKEYFSETREQQLEKLIANQMDKDICVKDSAIKFKGSLEFLIILGRLLKYYEKSIIDFQDIYYDGKVIYTRQELRNTFLDNRINMPIGKRLKRIENIILNKIHPLRGERLKKFQTVVETCDNHKLEIKSFARLLAVKESKNFMNYLRKFTSVDYVEVYKKLFNNKRIFYKLSKGLKLPSNIDDILEATLNNLEYNQISYEDSVALAYINLRLEDNGAFSHIKQVVIDEAQDYYPLQYAVLKLLFPDARYTVVGDYNQGLERHVNINLYDQIEQILNKNKSVRLYLKKSFRSSYEINSFTKRIVQTDEDIVSFERYEGEPQIIYEESIFSMDDAIAQDIKELYKKGYQTIGVICKTRKGAEEAAQRLNKLVDLKILDQVQDELKKGVMVVPSYLAKGLEFDAVIVYDVSRKNYKSELDRRLLYVACTRALHQLHIYYTEAKSKILDF